MLYSQNPIMKPFSSVRLFFLITPSEHVQHLIIHIQIVFLTFVPERSEIIENAYPVLRQTHVIPQLLTMIINKMLHSLAFDIHLLVHKEIHFVRVLYLLPMILGREGLRACSPELL